MRKLLIGFCFLLCSLYGNAASPLLSMSQDTAALNIEAVTEPFEWMFFSHDWKQSVRMNKKSLAVESFKNTKTSSVLQGDWLVLPGKSFKFTSSLQMESSGIYNYSASFKSEQAVLTGSLGMLLEIPLAAASAVEADSVIVPLSDNGEKLLVYEAAKLNSLKFQADKVFITLKGDFGVRIQDQRRYGKNAYELRIFPSPCKGEICNSDLNISIKLETISSLPLDLRGAANMGFIDETALDAKGGWTDQGADYDLRSMEPGRTLFAGINYDIINPVENGARSCIVVADSLFRRFPDYGKIRVPDSDSASWLYLLHSSAWTPKWKEPVGSVKIDYADGSTEEIKVISGEDCGNWWHPSPLANGRLVWTGEIKDGVVGLYSSAFKLSGKNPVQISFIPAERSVWMIVAASLANNRVSQELSEPYLIKEGASWIRTDLPADIVKGSVLDFSASLDAPAGKYGRIINRDGHFSFESKPESRIRFLGVNICNENCFMSREETDRMVQRFVKLGYNSVRLHHIDRRLLDPKADNTYTFDPVKLDQLQYLFAKCKEAGLYICIDLYSMRPIKPGDGIVECSSANSHEIKLLLPLSPSAMAHWKRYALKIMSIKNPYTGMSMAEDPALYSLNLVNEAALPANWNQYPKLMPLVQKRYAEYLQEKGIYSDELLMQRGTEFTQFLIEKEAQALDEMISFVKKDIAFRGLLTNYNFNEYYFYLPLRNKLDFVDNHAYQDHPNYPKQAWKLPASFSQKASLDSWCSVPLRLAASREFGKPYTLTEMSFCNPNRFRAECGPVFGALSALQDYDGYYRFSHGPNHDNEVPTYFNIDKDALAQISEKIIFFLFGRGDIQPAKDAIAFTWTPEMIKSLPSLNASFSENCARLALFGRTGTLPAGDIQKGISPLPIEPEWEAHIPQSWKGALDAVKSSSRIQSSTGEIEYDPAARSISAVSLKSEAFTIQSGAISGRVVSVKSADSFQTISVHSLDGLPIDKSSSILIFHLSNLAAEGMAFHDKSMTLLENWGKLPLLVRAAKADIAIKNSVADKMKVYRINIDGTRRNELFSVHSDSSINFTVDTGSDKANGACMIYHISKD